MTNNICFQICLVEICSQKNFHKSSLNLPRMQEQTGKPTLQNSKAREAHQHHRQRLVLAVLTVFPELTVDHVVANKVCECALFSQRSNHTMSRGNDSAGATHAPAWRMHFSHQGKPLLITHLLSPHDFGGWVATWQVRRDWQVHGNSRCFEQFGCAALAWLTRWLAGIDPQQERGKRTILSARAV